jgi:uncharacterized membrane protein YtjA (UPF0391 family)
MHLDHSRPSRLWPAHPSLGCPGHIPAPEVKVVLEHGPRTIRSLACRCQHHDHQSNLEIMLRWTLTFLVIAIIAAILGFGGVASGAAGIAKVLFFVFLVLFILSLIRGGAST